MKAGKSWVAALMVALATLPTAKAAAQDEQSGRPNVLVWMLDDVGFAQLSAFGGLVETPNIDRVAARGLRYTNYHTAPICSAARASFLTGRMPHSVHIGGHATAARALPGYDAQIPRSAGTIAANLQAAGYFTIALGKWDHLPSGHINPSGPFTYWPMGQGFEQFYGFLAADADNFRPTLVEGNRPVVTPDEADYHLSEDLADRAIDWIEQRHAIDPARPFFMYWATGAAHAPHHAPAEWRERYRGRFDMGWDAARVQILARQQQLGLVPADTALAPSPDYMPAWESLTADEQRLYTRQMEAFAAALSHADAQFGRMLDALEATGELDNTIIVITSDNGASAEGGPTGLYNEALVTGGQPPAVADNLRFYESWGGPDTFPHYAYGWALAGNTPFAYWKQTIHEGGTRVPLIVAWPSHIGGGGALRGDFVHVSDIAPTLLEAAGVPLSPIINDVVQQPMEGASFAASFARDGDPRDGRAQYVELYGNRGLWQSGWSIVATHRTRTWDWRTSDTFDEPWELYDLVNDPAQIHNLADRHPERVSSMAAEFLRQVRLYNVEPIHNLRDTARDNEQRMQADFDRRAGRWTYPGSAGHVAPGLSPPINFRSYAMRAELELDGDRATGTIFALGGGRGGLGLLLLEGRPTFVAVDLDGRLRAVSADSALPAGHHVLELEFRRGEPAPDGTLWVDLIMRDGTAELLRERVNIPVRRYYGIAETFGIGIDLGSTLLPDTRTGRPFPGSLGPVRFQFEHNESFRLMDH
jgi:arylsulfatase